MDHHFNVEFARLYGIEEAILIENIYWWVKKNKANNKNFYDGDYWTYNSSRAFSELFPYMNQQKIRRALINLEENGLIKTGNYNKLKYDRTLWYAITEKGLSVLNDPLYNLKNGNNKNEAPIPVLNPDNKSDIFNADQRSSNSEDSKESIGLEEQVEKVGELFKKAGIYLDDCSDSPEVNDPRALPVPDAEPPASLKPKKVNWYKNENNVRAMKYIREYITDYDPNYYFGEVEKTTMKNLINRLRMKDAEGNEVFDHEYFAEKWESYVKPNFWLDKGCKNLISFYKNINRIPV
jgi:DNA-binding PadR family transcriptional regulator